MIPGSVTNRYAEALFELARDKGVLDAVARDVEFLTAETGVEAVAAFLFDERVAPAEKRQRLAFLKPHVNGLTYHFVQLLCDKRRLEVLRDLGAVFRRRLLAERGAVEGLVESARPLDPAEVGSLGSALGRVFGKEVQLTSRIEPDLIGGVRVTVDHRMLDQSLRGRLRELRERLVQARIDTDTTSEPE